MITNPENIIKYPEPINPAYFGFSFIDPGTYRNLNRNLFNCMLTVNPYDPGKYLNIKKPSGYEWLFKHLFCKFSPEQLGPALGVVNHQLKSI